MTISVGDSVPSGSFKQITAEGMQELSTDELFGGKKVVLFSLPGAFTPTCSSNHLPRYDELYDEFKALGVD